MSKLQDYEIKNIADHVRKFFSESDRKLITPLFQHIKWINNEWAKTERLTQVSLIDKPVMRYPAFPPTIETKNQTDFKTYLRELFEKEDAVELDRISRVRRTTLFDLKELAYGCGGSDGKTA